jgi:hypothetical protein
MSLISCTTSDHRRAPLAPCRGHHPVELVQAVPDETRLQEQVLRRIPGDREFREQRDVRPGLLGALEVLNDACGVSVQVADPLIHLTQGDA